MARVSDSREDCHAPQNNDWMRCRGGDACRASDVGPLDDGRHGRYAQLWGYAQLRRPTHGQRMGKPSCRDVFTPPLRPFSPLSSLRPLPSLPSLCSLPASTYTLRQRYRRGQLLAVGANTMGLAQSVGLLLSTDRLVEGAARSGDLFIAAAA